MHKSFKNQSLHADAAPLARSAFSLAELVVAIGILVLMLSLAGQVFTITVQSTGKATALTEVSQQLRLLEENLRADLAAVDPQRTLLVIQGNPVNAFWTQENLEAGAAIAAGGTGDPATPYPHLKDPDREDASGNLLKPRADILFFYTARPGASALNPRVTSNVQQVLYGHADLGEYVWDGTQYQFNLLSGDPDEPQYFPLADFGGMFYPDPDEPSLIPAQQWHLARRSTLFVPTGNPPGSILPPLFGAANQSKRQQLLRGSADVIASVPFESIVLEPVVLNPCTEPDCAPYFLPAILSVPGEEPFLRSQLDVTPPPALLNASNQFYGLGHYMLPNCASFKVEWALDPRSAFVDGRLDGLTEPIWFDPGVESIGNRPADPLRALHDKIDALQVEISTAPSAQKAALQNVQKQLCSLLYDRVCLMANCDPGCTNPTVVRGTVFSLAERFEGLGFTYLNNNCPNPGFSSNCAWQPPPLALDGRRNLAIFTALRPKDADGDGFLTHGVDYDVPDPMFPGALRITVDVFDNRARLDRPIRHVMVIPIGS